MEINVSWGWTLLMIIVITVLGFIETGSAMGALMIFVIAVLISIEMLIGLIPILGPLIHYFVLYPWITNGIMGMQPQIHMPFTLILLLVVSTLMAVLYTIVTTILAAMFIAES
jgi:hypothetical protein